MSAAASCAPPLEGVLLRHGIPSGMLSASLWETANKVTDILNEKNTILNYRS